MNKIPIAFCLFTTTQGHFKIKTRYLETLESFNRLLHLSNFAERIAHIKISPGEEAIGEEMKKNLENRGFNVFSAVADWSHGTNTHQVEYISDMINVYSSGIQSPYVFQVEDDFLIDAPGGNFVSILSKAIELFENSPETMQIRIPRFENEFDRINRLKEKHNINGIAKKHDKTFFYCNDYSMNPSMFRLRDIKLGLNLLHRTPQLPFHVEHGLGLIMKTCSLSTTPFAVFNPEVLQIAHIGTRLGDEDNFEKGIVAT